MTIGDEVFVYNGLPTRVVFGFGTRARVGEETGRLGVKRPLVLSTLEQKQDAQSLAMQLGMEPAGIFSEAAMHTPVGVTEKALALVSKTQADGLIAVGEALPRDSERRLRCGPIYLRSWFRQPMPDRR